jgi:Putative zinc-finger
VRPAPGGVAVAEPGGRGAHPRDAVSLYVVGALDGEEREAVEAHLAVCSDCLAEADELGRVAAALASLSDEDAHEIVADYLAETAARQGIGGGALRSGAAGPKRTTRRPAPGRSATVWRGLRDRRTRALVAVVALASVVLLSIGAALGLMLDGGATDGVSPGQIPLAATASDPSTGAGLSVLVVGHGDTVTVRATVTGLRGGTRYQLYAVTSDGRTSVVCTWLGSPTAQDVGGDLGVPVNRLAFFSVVSADGTPVVAAVVTSHASSPIPHPLPRPARS